MDFLLSSSFGFRPRQSAHDALQMLVDETCRGRRWVVETDIAECFSAIPHDRLMQLVEERVLDQPGPGSGRRSSSQRVVFWLYLDFCFSRPNGLIEMLPNRA
jgi:hypothetical protein